MPDVCCIIGLCCPPEERRRRIAAWLGAAAGKDPLEMMAHTDAFIAHIDSDPFVQQLQALVTKSHLS